MRNWTDEQLAQWEREEAEQEELEALRDVQKGIWTNDDGSV